MTNSKLQLIGIAMSIVVSGAMCSCNREDPSPKPLPAETVELDRFYDGIYFGDFWSEGYANYYFVLSDCPVGSSDDGYAMPTKVGGHVMYIDLWGSISADHTTPIVPEGRYTAHTGRAEWTFDLKTTIVTVNEEQIGDEYVVRDILFSDGTIDIRHVSSGYEIVADLITTDGVSMRFTYNGAMALLDKSNDDDGDDDDNDNLIHKDLQLDIKRVTRQQYDEGSGVVDTYVLRCFDVDRISDNGLSPYGAGTKLQIGLYTAKGAGLNGSFVIGERSDYTAGTFYPGSWLGLQAVGTFCLQVDEQNNNKYCLISDGTIDIKDNGDGTHTIKCDLVDEEGYKVTCDWTGTIEEYAVTESVQTTLTDDVVFNPTQCSSVSYLGDYFFNGTSAYNIMLADDDEVLAIDICAASGDSTSLPTGTYTVDKTHDAGTVSAGRISAYYAEPTAYVRYDISGGEGTAVDMAPIVGGSVTIRQTGSEYSIEYEFFDDLNRNDASIEPNKISGSWQGVLPPIEDYFGSASSASVSLKLQRNR